MQQLLQQKPDGVHGITHTKQIAKLLEGSPTRILAASLKSPTEAVAAFTAGASRLTLPIEVPSLVTEDPHSIRAVEQLDQYQTNP